MRSCPLRSPTCTKIDRVKVASGQKKSSDLHAIPARAAKRMKYKLHPEALAAFQIKR